MPVSDRDVEHIRRAFETFDVDRLRAGDVGAYFEEFYDDHAIVEHAEAFPVAEKRHVDRDGYLQYFEDTYGAYADVHWDVEQVRAVGERVFVVARISGHPHGDPTRLEVRLALVYRLNAGRIAHVQVFLTPQLALEAAQATSLPGG
jgi:ketosteroid isomerase-like protein